MSKHISTKVFRKIDDIGQDALNSIVDDGFFNYGWFKTLEISKHTDLDPFYLTVFKQDKLVAFAPCFHDIADEFFRFSPRIGQIPKKLLKLRSQLHLGKNHFLMCYSPSCYRSKIFTTKTLNQKILIHKISQEIDHICKKEKILFSSFLFVSEFDKKLSQYLSNIGYHKFLRTKSSFYHPITWPSFKDYLGSLKGKVRKNIKREMRECLENGVTIEERTKFKDLSILLSDLSANLYDKKLS